jgi:hypothetical protein
LVGERKRVPDLHKNTNTMNIILKRIFGNYELPKKKQKREVERVLGITQYGEVIVARGCMPADRDKTIKEIFDSMADVVTINVSPLKGRTKIITR